MSKNDFFHNPTQGKMDLTAVVREISEYINYSPSDKYCLVVGTDSAGVQQANTDFITAVIVHRIGRGGRYFWRRVNDGKTYFTFRDRIYNEVTLSLQTAQDLLAQLKKDAKGAEKPNYDLQIHIDVGKNGPTRAMIKEVVGMVKGNGFEVKIKPESYAASKVADKYT